MSMYRAHFELVAFVFSEIINNLTWVRVSLRVLVSKIHLVSFLPRVSLRAETVIGLFLLQVTYVTEVFGQIEITTV